MNRKLVAIPAIALAAGLSLAACGNSNPIGSPNDPAGPTAQAVIPGNASATQVCGLLVNTTVSEGAEAGQTIESATTNESAAGPDMTGDTYGLGTAGQNEIKTCQITLSDGTYLNAQVTLFPNGTWGWHDES